MRLLPTPTSIAIPPAPAGRINARRPVKERHAPALEEWEVEQGYVLARQSRCKTAEREFDYDEN